MDFSEEQLKEAGKALEMNVRPEYLIEYLKPETSVEEMKDKLKNIKKDKEKIRHEEIKERHKGNNIKPFRGNIHDSNAGKQRACSK